MLAFSGTASGLKRPCELHCVVFITARTYSTLLMSDVMPHEHDYAVLDVTPHEHDYAALVWLMLLREAATLPSTGRIALITVLRLFLPLILIVTTMTWLLWIPHVPTTCETHGQVSATWLPIRLRCTSGPAHVRQKPKARMPLFRAFSTSRV